MMANNQSKDLYYIFDPLQATRIYEFPHRYVRNGDTITFSSLSGKPASLQSISGFFLIIHHSDIETYRDTPFPTISPASIGICLDGKLKHDLFIADDCDTPLLLVHGK